MNEDCALQVNAVNYSAPNEGNTLCILKNIDLTINHGETLAITGSSGSGKTTLLNIMGGLLQPTSGEVWLHGKRMDNLDEDGRAKLRAKQMAFIYQSFLLLENLTALENVLLPLEINQVPNAVTTARQWLAKVGLSERERHHPNQLSGGEQQRVAIARAFVCSPKLLFADEPTGNLDNKSSAHIASLLFELNQQQQTTLVLVTHDLKLAGMCQKQLRLDSGQIQ